MKITIHSVTFPGICEHFSLTFYSLDFFVFMMQQECKAIVTYLSVSSAHLFFSVHLYKNAMLINDLGSNLKIFLLPHPTLTLHFSFSVPMHISHNVCCTNWQDRCYNGLRIINSEQAWQGDSWDSVLCQPESE